MVVHGVQVVRIPLPTPSQKVSTDGVMKGGASDEKLHWNGEERSSEPARQERRTSTHPTLTKLVIWHRFPYETLNTPTLRRRTERVLRTRPPSVGIHSSDLFGVQAFPSPPTVGVDPRATVNRRWRTPHLLGNTCGSGPLGVYRCRVDCRLASVYCLGFTPTGRLGTVSRLSVLVLVTSHRQTFILT